MIHGALKRLAHLGTRVRESAAGVLFGVDGKPAPRDMLRGVRMGGLRLRIRILRVPAIIATLFGKQIAR
jgi:hypothetical protein